MDSRFHRTGNTGSEMTFEKEGREIKRADKYCFFDTLQIDDIIKTSGKKFSDCQGEPCG